MTPLSYLHVDVFSAEPYSGNSLPVFLDARGLSPQHMLHITQELRHFEATFLEPSSEPGRLRARIFDLFEELPFAGHPLIGAAAALHHHEAGSERRIWHFELTTRTVQVESRKTEKGYFAVLDQGTPTFLGQTQEVSLIAQTFGLHPADLHPHLPLEVVSTGLAYLIVPLQPGTLEHARIQTDLTPLLRPLGAQFAVLLDPETLEIRHWNNDGLLEDVATGSAAGTVGAYLCKHRPELMNTPFTLQQGRFLNRASRLHVEARGSTSDPANVQSILVGGDVAVVGHGTLIVLP